MAQKISRGIPITLVSSSARTTSSNSGSLKDTTGAFPVGSAVSLYVDCTANAGDDASTTGGLTVYLDHSPDNGTTWLLAEKFARVTGSTGTQVINFRMTGIGATEAAAQTWVMSTTSSIAQATNTVLAPDIRVRWTLGNGTNAVVVPTSTFAVFAIVQPIGATAM